MLKNNAGLHGIDTFGDDCILPKSNQVRICGVIEDEFKYSHENSAGKFYMTRVIVENVKGKKDYIPIVVKEELLREHLGHSLKGKYIKAIGSFVSYTERKDNGNKRKHLQMYPMKVAIYENEADVDGEKNVNDIYLEGKICKAPNFRIIQPHNKYITDFMIAVKRTYPTIDFIPCVTWGSKAIIFREMAVGDKIKVLGGIRSREYIKKNSENPEEREYRTAYEVCIQKILEN